MEWIGLLCVIGMVLWIGCALALGGAADEVRWKALDDLKKRKV